MFYSEKMPHLAEKPALIERRLKITKLQSDAIADLETRLNIPASAMVC